MQISLPHISFRVWGEIERLYTSLFSVQKTGHQSLEAGARIRVLRHICVVKGRVETGGQRSEMFFILLICEGSAVTPISGQNTILLT